MSLNYFSAFNLFDPLQRLQKQRHKLLQDSACPALLRPLLQSAIPSRKAALHTLSYLVIDFETTGFNPMIDKILSIAAVPIEQLSIKLADSYHQFIQETQINQDSVIVHHILPSNDNTTDAVLLENAMQHLFTMMQNRIIIAHGSNIEKRFIQHYLATQYQLKTFPLLWLDTLRIERSLTPFNHNNNYQLNHLRQQYHLPQYVAHNALIDAIAAGELFLAQIVKLFAKQPTNLGEVYKRSTR